MHPYIAEVLVAERARDLQAAANAARLARRLRRGRSAASAALQEDSGDFLRLAAGNPPDSYAEFLFRTSRPLLPEPSAAERARGQAVR